MDRDDNTFFIIAADSEGDDRFVGSSVRIQNGGFKKYESEKEATERAKGYARNKPEMEFYVLQAVTKVSVSTPVEVVALSRRTQM